MEEYAGYVTMVNLSANNLIAVKAKPDKLETVQKALQARKDFEVESFRQYLPDQYAMSEAGKVFTVGDYCFLVIMGRMDEDPASEISAIEQIIRDFPRRSAVFSVNCLFRYKLFSEQGYMQGYLRDMAALGNHAGFVGYGEHYNNRFVNQSMTCVVFE